MDQPIRFPGQYADDETGYHHNYYRDYAPDLGRYIQADPIGIMRDFSDPQMQVAMRLGIPIQSFGQGLNHTYGYVENNPVSRVGPFGLDSYSVNASTSWFGGGAGGTAAASVGIDDRGQVCFQVTTCGRVGAGNSAAATFGFKHSTSDFSEGDSASGGAFCTAGSGPLSTVSVTTDGDNLTTTANYGFGAGLSFGSQACLTKTFCSKVN